MAKCYYDNAFSPRGQKVEWFLFYLLRAATKFLFYFYTIFFYTTGRTTFIYTGKVNVRLDLFIESELYSVRYKEQK